MPSGNNFRPFFAGKPVKDFTLEEGVVDPTSFAYLLSCDNQKMIETEEMEQIVEAFLGDPLASQVSALLIGGDIRRSMESGDYGYEVQRLVASREKLPALNALFLGALEIPFDDGELLIGLSDVSPLFEAYPQLEYFHAYGWMRPWQRCDPQASELRLGTINLESLRSLSLATEGLKPEQVQDIWQSHLPALEHLELWLANKATTVDDFAPLLSGELFPHLRHLSLCNSPYEDDLVQALTTSPLLDRLKVLDVSMGVFTDRGAQALLDCPAIRRLEKLVVRYHFCTDEMVERLQALPLEVEISDREDESDDDDEDRMVDEWWS
jgi:hypothetical protein